MTIKIIVNNEENVQKQDSHISSKHREIKTNNPINKRVLYFAKNQAISITKQAVNEYLDINGKGALQKDLNNVFAIGTPLASIAIGFTTGGVVGGVLATLGSAISLGINEFKTNESIAKQNQSIEYAYQVTGNASLKGSRYTND